MNIAVPYVKPQCFAELDVKVCFILCQLHLCHNMWGLLLKNNPDIAHRFYIAALCHEVTLLNVVRSQTFLHCSWEQLNIITIKFSYFHIVYYLVGYTHSHRLTTVANEKRLVGVH